MVFPAVKLHQLYSLNLYDGMDIIFENLEMVNINNLEEVIKTENYDIIKVVNRIFTINTRDRTITISGHKINNKTYIINMAGKGDLMLLHYSCKNEDIITGIKYLYYMYKSHIKASLKG